MWFDPDIAERILEALHQVVMDEDPNALTMINLEALSAMSHLKKYSKYCDILGLDFYPNYLKATPIDVARLSGASLAGHVSGKPVMIAETGYPSGPRIMGYST
jgi:hypothetical protein